MSARAECPKPLAGGMLLQVEWHRQGGYRISPYLDGAVALELANRDSVQAQRKLDSLS